MMKRGKTVIAPLKLTAVFAAAVLFLCGCGGDGVKTNKTVKEYETDFSAVRAEVLTIGGTKNTQLEDEINSMIESNVESELVAFDSMAQESDSKNRMGNKCMLDISWKEHCNENGFLSISEESYTYTGGAHGSSERKPINIDISAGKQVHLSDLFSDDGYRDTLNRMINECIMKNPDNYRDLWAKAEIKDSHQTDFYINDGKLIIFFQPYELSYYARGFVEFPLSLEELEGYLKEEYRRLI
jgi:hypothetical protein